MSKHRLRGQFNTMLRSECCDALVYEVLGSLMMAYFLYCSGCQQTLTFETVEEREANV